MGDRRSKRGAAAPESSGGSVPQSGIEAFSVALGRELDRGASMVQAKRAAAFAVAEWKAGRWHDWGRRWQGAKAAAEVNAAYEAADAIDPPTAAPVESPDDWGAWWREGSERADALLRAIGALQAASGSAWWDHHRGQPKPPSPSAPDMLRSGAALVELRRSELRAVVDRGSVLPWGRLPSDYPGEAGERARCRGQLLPARYHLIAQWRRMTWEAREVAWQACALADVLEAMPGSGAA